MKDWWMNLSLREKQTVSLGSLLILLFLFYQLIWSPFHAKIANLRQQVQQDHELLQWMQMADQKIQTLSHTKSGKAQLTGSLLSTVQNQLKQSPLAQSVAQLRQGENNTIQLSLKKADFDQLIVFLTHLSNQYGFVVTQMTVTPTGTPGAVSAELVMNSSL